MRAADFANLPPHPLLRIEITADGRVIVDGQDVEVPRGDVRAAAVDAAEDYAARRGHPVRVIVATPDGARAMLIAEPGVRANPRPVSGRQMAAAYMLLKEQPQPPQDDAGDVPAWPTLVIRLHADGLAEVEGHPVPQIPGFTVYQAAVAAAALHARSLGLARPVRAVAADSDGTRWPLVVYPNGSAKAAGDPKTPAKKRARLFGF